MPSHTCTHTHTHTHTHSEKIKGLPAVQPLFITVDPKRDSPDKIKKYLSGSEQLQFCYTLPHCVCHSVFSCPPSLSLPSRPPFIVLSPSLPLSVHSEFHPRLLGLTGTEEEIERATKAYRVYSTIGPSDSPDDYLVHTRMRAHTHTHTRTHCDTHTHTHTRWTTASSCISSILREISENILDKIARQAKFLTPLPITYFDISKTSDII